MTKKSKILIIVCKIFTLLFVIGIFVFFDIKKQANTSDNNIFDESQNIIDESDGYRNFVNNTKIFSISDNTIEKKYIVDGNKYHIRIDKDSNIINVNDMDIYNPEGKIISVYIMKDILLVETSSNCTNNLVLLRMDGNILKTISGVMPYYSKINDMEIIYSIDSYEGNDNEIYAAHYNVTYSLTYLGNNKFSEPTKLEDKYNTMVYTPSCSLLNDKYTIYDNNGLEINVGKVRESFVQKKLYVNGTSVDIAYCLDSITLLPDNYILVRSYYQDGFDEYIYIVDFNGNIVTDFNKRIGEGYFVSHPLLKDVNEIYSNGTFNIYAMSSEAIEKMGRYLSDIESYPSDYIIGKLWKFNYLGNGKVDDGYIERNITIEDFNN